MSDRGNSPVPHLIKSSTGKWVVSNVGYTSANTNCLRARLTALSLPPAQMVSFKIQGVKGHSMTSSN